MLRVAAVSGVCALLLLVPVIILGRVTTPAALSLQAGRQAVAAVSFLYLMFGVAFLVFIYGFVCIGERRASRILSLSGYLLMVAYFLTVLLAVLAGYFDFAHWLAPTFDLPLIVVRGGASVLLGIAMLNCNPRKQQLAFWVGIFALMSGIGTLFQLVGAGWDDIAGVPFLITGAMLFFSAAN